MKKLLWPALALTACTPFPEPPGPLPVGPSADLRITEVMWHPDDANPGQFVEIYNNAGSPVDLSGWSLGDGRYTDTLVAFQGGPTVVAASSYALVLDRAYPGGYDIPSQTPLLTIPGTAIDGGLHSASPVLLFPPGSAFPVSTYGMPLLPSPDDPLTGCPLGFSVERVAIQASDLEGSWCVSVDPSGSTPGRPNSGC